MTEYVHYEIQIYGPYAETYICARGDENSMREQFKNYVDGKISFSLSSLKNVDITHPSASLNGRTAYFLSKVFQGPYSIRSHVQYIEQRLLRDQDWWKTR